MEKKLIGVKNPFVVLSNHKNLQYFVTTRKLSERQVRWSLTFSQFRFQLKFRAGKKAQRPNALSKRKQDMPGGKKDKRFKNQINQLLKNEWLPSKYRLKKIRVRSNSNYQNQIGKIKKYNGNFR
jgi:hypothetical protein